MKWLSAAEKRIVAENIAREESGKKDTSLSGVFRNNKVWLLGFIYFCASRAAFYIRSF